MENVTKHDWHVAEIENVATLILPLSVMTLLPSSGYI